MPEIYRYAKHVAFHETDSMGVMHHANYVRYFEEARVSWLRELGVISMHMPMGPLTFAVVDMNCQFLKPARFEDRLEVLVEGRLEGVRIVFRYAVWLARINAMVAKGETILVPLNPDLRPTRLPMVLRELFSRQNWSPEWPPAMTK